MTLEESFGTLAGISVAFIGDGDNVCHSLMQAAGPGRVRAPRGHAARLRAGIRRSWPRPGDARWPRAGRSC